MSAANSSLQQQLYDLTEKYNTLQEHAKRLELENTEYQKEIRNLSEKDNELELTLEELNRTQTQIQEQQSLLTNENKENVSMLEEESDINKQLKSQINENILTINKLIQSNKALKETNNKYETKLTNLNSKLIKLENDNKIKTKQYNEKIEENQFLSTELQVLQSVLGNQYKNTLSNNELSPQTKPLLPANKTIDLLTPLGNLLPPKTPNYKFSGDLLSPQSQQPFDSRSPLQLGNISSNDNQMTFFAMNAVSRDNTLRSDVDIYSGGSTLRSNVSDSDVNYDISIDMFEGNEPENVSNNEKSIGYYKFQRYKQMSSRIIGINEKKELEVNNEEIIINEMNKQRMEYEILLQSLNDENELLTNKLKVLSNENGRDGNYKIENDQLVNERNELLNRYKNLLETHNKCIGMESKLNEKMKLINKLNKKNRELKNKMETVTVTDSSDSRCYSVGKWWEFCQMSN